MKEKEILQAAIGLLIAAFLVNSLISFIEGSEKPLIVLSGSMTPMMLPGDMIIVKSVDPNELKVGDVIAFRPPESKPNTLITHRIISLEEGKEPLLQTKGDANNEKDEFKVQASSVVGKLIFVIPFLGYLPELLKNKSNLLLMIILHICILAVDETRNLIILSNPARARKIEKKKKKSASKTCHVVKRGKLTAFILISGLIFTCIFMYNPGYNRPVTLEKENKVENSGFLPIVYVFTPEDLNQKFAIESWYGVVSPSNETKVVAPGNIHAKMITVPYILPVFWIVELAEINSYLPEAAEIVVYVSIFLYLISPLWYRKSTIEERRRRIKFHRLLAQWKRAFHLG